MKSITITYKDIHNVKRELQVDSTITELDLSSKGIVALDDLVFGKLSNLKTLWLNENNITFLHENTFYGLEKLEKLYLFYNKLQSLPKDIFKPLKNLKRLELSMNKLAYLDETIFSFNTKLEKLSLDFNELSQLPLKIFDNLTYLHTLVLSSNNLISLPDEIFQNLNRLRFLSLSFNSLSNLPKKFFTKNNSNLEELRLDNNPFKILDLTAVQYTPKLTKIDILYCTGLEKIILEPVESETEINLVPDAKIDFSATSLTQPPPVIIARGLRAIVDYYSPEKTIYSSLTEIRLSFGISGPEVKVDRCVLCKKEIFEKDRNICKECESFYDDQFALGS